MYKELIKDLKDNPEVARYILQNELNMFEYFLEVFRYNGVKEIPEEFEVFYLSYEYAKVEVEKALKQVQDAIEELS